jgi:hypothetical protein
VDTHVEALLYLRFRRREMVRAIKPFVQPVPMGIDIRWM